MNRCFIETLPSRCSLSGKGISAAVYRTVGADVNQGLLKWTGRTCLFDVSLHIFTYDNYLGIQ